MYCGCSMKSMGSEFSMVFPELNSRPFLVSKICTTGKSDMRKKEKIYYYYMIINNVLKC